MWKWFRSAVTRLRTGAGRASVAPADVRLEGRGHDLLRARRRFRYQRPFPGGTLLLADEHDGDGLQGDHVAVAHERHRWMERPTEHPGLRGLAAKGVVVLLLLAGHRHHRHPGPGAILRRPL